MSESRSEKNQEIIKEIEKEERIQKSKKVIKIFLWIFIPLVTFIFLSYFMLRYVGNMGIEVREYPVYIDNESYNINGLKIVQFSDIHLNNSITINKVKELVKTINKANPDIVIFTGDLIDKGYSLSNEQKEELITELNQIKAKIGKYAIYGDEDKLTFKNILDSCDFEILDNTSKKVYISSIYINLIAVDSTYSISDFTSNTDDALTIVLTHKPDLADRIISDFNPDIILAGHSHNGQIVLPLIGPLIRKDGAKKYPSSYYEINNTKLYVSGGIGNSYFQFRLLNHPSINFLRIRTSK
jgi:hypothetical protein